MLQWLSNDVQFNSYLVRDIDKMLRDMIDEKFTSCVQVSVDKALDKTFHAASWKGQPALHAKLLCLYNYAYAYNTC